MNDRVRNAENLTECGYADVAYAIAEEGVNASMAISLKRIAYSLEKIAEAAQTVQNVGAQFSQTSSLGTVLGLLNKHQR